MLWGIDRPEWIQLWSGAVGAFLAAVIGGLVALAVVRLTNRNQARLAGEAREKSAIADLVASSDRLLTEYAEGRHAIEPLTHLIEAASVRWRMELSDKGMEYELASWPMHLRNRAVGAYDAGIGSRDNKAEFDELLRAVAEFRFAVMGWHSCDEKTRAFLVRKLRNLRGN